MLKLKLLVITLCSIFFLSDLSGKNTPSCPVDSLIEKLSKIDTNDLEHVLYQVDMEIKAISESIDTTCQIALYKAYALKSGGQGNYYLLFNSLWKAQLLADQAQLVSEQFELNMDIARYYSYLKRYQESQEHFRIASGFKKQLSNRGVLKTRMIIDFYFYQMKMYKLKNDFDTAKTYLDSCYQYIDRIQPSFKFNYLEFERALFLSHEHKYEEALEIFKTASAKIAVKNPPYEGIMLKHIGDAYYNSSQIDKSLQAYNKAIDIIIVHNKHIDFLPRIYDRLAEISFERSNYKAAFNWLKEKEKINFKLYDSRSELNSYFLNIQDDFRLYKEEEQKRNSKQEYIQLQQNQKLLLFQRIMLVGSLIFIILLGFFYSKFQKSKLQMVKGLNDQLNEKNSEVEQFLQRIEKKNEELITFSNIMSHDLKAPLRNISAFSGLIRKQIEKGFNEDKVLGHLQFITDATNTMSVLIEDLLFFSKINMEENNFSSVNLNDVITLVLPAFAFDINSGQAEINIKKMPIIYGDGNLLKTVFNNIISNAIKYQPKDKPDQKALIDIWSEEEESAVSIYIRDNGIGIKPEYVEKLFKPFVRFHSVVEYSGTGLGMSICDRIMKNHNGSITLESSDSLGSVFKLSFPKVSQKTSDVEPVLTTMDS